MKIKALFFLMISVTFLVVELTFKIRKNIFITCTEELLKFRVKMP